MRLKAPYPWFGLERTHRLCENANVRRVGSTSARSDHPHPLCEKGPRMAVSQPIGAPDQSQVEYREVLGFPGYYVGNDGSVWSAKLKGGNDRTANRLTDRWSQLSTHRNRRGYVLVNLTKDGRNYARFVHRLVLEAFVGLRPYGMEACHYPDANKANNRLSNLRWDTHQENIRDDYRDRIPASEKNCRTCGETKPISDFYGDKRASDGLKSECKRCHCARRNRVRA